MGDVHPFAEREAGGVPAHRLTERVALRKTGRVIQVWFTGVVRARSRWLTLFDPPLHRALRVIADDLGRHPAHIGVMASIDTKEPPGLRGSVVLLSSRPGEGRFPLAYLTAENAALTLAEVREALAAIGGEPC